MASGETGPASAPDTFQREMPVSEQLVQVKDAVVGKINEAVDQSKLSFAQPQNDPANKASDEALKRDVDTTAKDATNSYNKALNQVSEAFYTVQAKGRQAAEQMGITSDAEKIQTPKSLQGVDTEGGPSLLQSLGNAISQTAQSVKGAFVSATNEGTSAPTTTKTPPSTPTSQPVSENIGQKAAAMTDAVKNTLAPRETVPGSQPGMENLNTGLPQDVPRRAPQ